MADDETIAVYNAQAEAYVDCIPDVSKDAELLRFLGSVSKRGKILDLGCGPGMQAAYMRQQGFDVDPVDASLEMVKIAHEKFKVPARLATFDDISEQAVYDGVWANFSLLHAAPLEFPNYLKAIKDALKPGGVFHIALKTGNGVIRDKLGRNYTYYSQAELTQHVVDAGFTTFDVATGESPGLAGDVSAWVAILSRA